MVDNFVEMGPRPSVEIIYAGTPIDLWQRFNEKWVMYGRYMALKKYAYWRKETYLTQMVIQAQHRHFKAISMISSNTEALEVTLYAAIARG